MGTESPTNNPYDAYSPGTVGANALGDRIGGVGGEIFTDILAPQTLLWGKKGGAAPPMLLGPDQRTMAQDMARQRALSKMYGEQLDTDLNKGYRAANMLVPQNAYGRIDEQPYQNKLQGFDSMEYQALRDKSNRENMRSYATSRENLARNQAYSGVRGPTASYQAAKLGRDFNRGNIEANQNLMIQNVGQKEKALANLSDVQKYNQGRAEKELGSRLGIQFGYGQLGSAQRAGAAQYMANKDAMEMQRNMFNMQQLNSAKSSGGGK